MAIGDRMVLALTLGGKSMPRTIEVEVFSYAELIQRAKEDPGNRRKQAALDKVQEQLRDWVTSDGVISDNVWDILWKPALEQIGFNNPQMCYSGFWSQGDGASFTSDWVDLRTLLSFLTAKIEPTTVISSLESDPVKEDFRGWILEKIGCNHNLAESDYSALLDQGVNPSLDNVEDYLSVRVVRIDSHYCHERTCRLDYESRGSLPESVLDSLLDHLEKLRHAICRAIYQDLQEEYEHLTSDEYLLDFFGDLPYFWDSGGQRFLVEDPPAD